MSSPELTLVENTTLVGSLKQEKNVFHWISLKNGTINTPYSNSFAPKTDFDYPSIMIEVNKKLYLRKNNELQADAYKFHYKIVRLYKEILGSNF